VFLWDDTKQLGCFPLEHFIWLYGFSSQFKSSRTWFFVGQYPSLTSCVALLPSCQMTWNFFAFSQGGSGRCKSIMQMGNPQKKVKPNELKLQNAHGVMLYLKAKVDKHHVSHNNAENNYE
jgi:hypothetical protein